MRGPLDTFEFASLPHYFQLQKTFWARLFGVSPLWGDSAGLTRIKNASAFFYWQAAHRVLMRFKQSVIDCKEALSLTRG
jgi:hypothetical protein